MLNGFDAALLVLAAAAVVVGVRSKTRLISLGADENRSDKRDDRANGLAKAVFLHERILRRRPEGIQHLCLFAAFFFPLAIILLVQFPFKLPKPLAGIISLTLDIVGLLGLYGTISLIVRRYAKRPDHLDNKTEDLWGLCLLLAIFLTGFSTAGLRISITGGDWLWNPVSRAASMLFAPLSQDAAAITIKFMWRAHMFLVLAAIASLPFGKLSHLIFIFQKHGAKGGVHPHRH